MSNMAPNAVIVWFDFNKVCIYIFIPWKMNILNDTNYLLLWQEVRFLENFRKSLRPPVYVFIGIF